MKTTGRITLKSAWYFALVASICFEGLGRKFLPMIPSAAFYYLKDFVLLLGYFFFPRPAYISKVNIWLYRGFKLIWMVGLFWTVVELFNPEQTSTILAAIGIRAYWLWWAAPPIIANILNDDQEKRRAIYVLLGAAALVSVFAAVQFVLPTDSAFSIYSVVEGEEIGPTIVYSTGRSRVSSTFSYITGFSNFTVLVPTLILALGLDAREPRLRKIAFVVTCMTAAVVPMAGARSSILLGLAVLVISAWSAGLLVTAYPPHGR